MKAGTNKLASFSELSKSFGSTGSSAATPSKTLNSPTFVKNNEALYGRKNSKSDCIFEAGFGISTVTAPIPSNCLSSKLNVESVAESWSTVETVVDVPDASSQVGLKS